MNERGECPVLDLLMRCGIPGQRLLADLTQSVPERGPPTNNSEATKPLREKIFEFREPVKKGGTLRVLYFYDKGHVVVCANGILKKSNKTPDELIDAAVTIRKRYFADAKCNQLQIHDLTPMSCNGDYNGIH